MKNKSAIKIVLLVVLALIVITVILFIKSLYKKVYTVEEYTQLLNNYQYNVVDKTTDYSNDSTVKTYLQAKDKEGTYQIDFFIMNNEKSASNYYKNIKKELTREANGLKSNEKSSKTGFEKYTVEANGNYSVIIRSKNTIIYSNAKSTKKEKINTLIRLLQY